MDLDQLKAFVLVSRKGNLSYAAKSLRLTPPAISLRLKGLEAELGVRLFERRPNKLLLTESGRLFSNQVGRLLNELDSAVVSVRAEEEHSHKNITMAVGNDTALLLGETLAGFIKNKPLVKLSLLTRRPSETLEMVLDDRVDFGIGRFLNIPRQLESMDLHLPRRLVAVCLKNSPNLGPKRLSIHQLASQPIITLPQRSATRSVLDEIFAKHGLEMKVSIEAAGCSNIKQFVRLGLGVGLIHDICVAKEEQVEFEIRDLNHLFGQWKTTLVYKKSRPLSSTHIELINTILSAISRRKHDKLPYLTVASNGS